MYFLTCVNQFPLMMLFYTLDIVTQFELHCVVFILTQFVQRDWQIAAQLGVLSIQCFDVAKTLLLQQCCLSLFDDLITVRVSRIPTVSWIIWARCVFHSMAATASKFPSWFLSILFPTFFYFSKPLLGFFTFGKSYRVILKQEGWFEARNKSAFNVILLYFAYLFFLASCL